MQILQKKSILIILGVIVFLADCASKPVSFDSTPVKDSFAIHSANAFYHSEAMATSILAFLQARAVPENPEAIATFRHYVIEIAPKIQLTLDTGREALQAYVNASPLQDEGSKVEAMLKLLETILAEAIRYAAEQGWKEDLK